MSPARTVHEPWKAINGPDGRLHGSSGWSSPQLLAPLAVLAFAAPASAAECAGSLDESCIRGTIRTEVGVVPNVDVHVTGPGGFDETATTDDEGKWSVVVTDPGDYTAEIVEDTLPSGVGKSDEGRSRCPKTVKVTGNGCSRRRSESAPVTTPPPSPPPTASSGARSTASGSGCCWPSPAIGLVADLRHHRPLELRARRAGDPGRHARLRPRSTCTASASGSAASCVVILVRLHRLVPGP